MDKNALVISKRLKFPYNDRTDKNIIAQPIMNLQSFNQGTPDSLNSVSKDLRENRCWVPLKCTE